MIGSYDGNNELEFGNADTETWYLHVRALAYAVDKSILDASPDHHVALENATILSEMLLMHFPEYRS